MKVKLPHPPRCRECSNDMEPMMDYMQGEKEDEDFDWEDFWYCEYCEKLWIVFYTELSK